MLTLKPEVEQGLKDLIQLPFDHFIFPYSSTSKRGVDGHPRSWHLIAIVWRSPVAIRG